MGTNEMGGGWKPDSKQIDLLLEKLHLVSSVHESSVIVAAACRSTSSSFRDQFGCEGMVELASQRTLFVLRDIHDNGGICIWTARQLITLRGLHEYTVFTTLATLDV